MALALGEKHGFKNSQVTVLAPTGTIGFMMDCDTTGIEPDLALVKYKKLVGGGVIKIVNNTVPAALMKLGYTPEETSQIVSYIDKNGKVEGAPGFKTEHLPIFDCSLAAPGGRSIAWRGHLKMMAAAQPFLSGAISKTINMPEESTVEDVMQAYIESWKLGVKAVAIYRDNSKGSQPLSAAGDKKDTAQQTQPAAASAAAPVAPAVGAKATEPATGVAEQRELFIRAHRRKLPSERSSITHKFSIGGHEGYITVGMYETGEPGEIFIKMAKEGSTLSGFMDGFALSVSIGLQYGVPLKALVDKFINTRFEPAGYTGHPAIPYAKSVLDYIARWLGGRFISPDYLTHNGEAALPAATVTATPTVPPSMIQVEEDEAASPARAAHSGMSARADSRPMFDGAPTCSECGMLMTPNGACYKCENCGGTSGCS
jgi:ribonucleoside-diphosphate reductase alpha chain